jgi:putative methionine-R-sulfoxide reductase with GAF domain
MDHYSIVGQQSSAAGTKTAPVSPPPAADRVSSAGAAREALQFPGEDGGKSLSQMAQRDLDATLQLLAERAQYIAGASGAAIALLEGESMICCASAGPSAPKPGMKLQVESGLSAESVRTRQTMRCDDAETDPRVNRESCRAIGIASVVVMPLLRESKVYGVFELLSGKPRAFGERDLVALQRLSEMIQTAMDHAEAARRAEKELSEGLGPTAPTALKPSQATIKPMSASTHPGMQVLTPETATKLETAARLTAPPRAAPAIASNPTLAEMLEIAARQEQKIEESAPAGATFYGNIGKCGACGFPVSEGRKLCLDCEDAVPGTHSRTSPNLEFADLTVAPEGGWLRSHVYLIATVLIAAATIAVLVWRF